MGERISIKQIADEAGVSTATVSRVINTPERVTEARRARVQSIIRRYHYQPSLLAKSLRNSSTPIIGMMVPDIANEFFAKIVIHLQRDLFEAGYWTIIYNSDLSGTMQQSYLKLLMDQNICGLFVISNDSASIELPEHVPTVFVDRHPRDCTRFKKHAIVESDNRQGGMLAAEALLRAGCQQPAMITTNEDIHIFSDREQGFESALRGVGLALDPSLTVRMRQISVSMGEQAVLQLIDAGETFDGLFATADFFAIGALQGLKARGIRVPADVKLVGFDDNALTRFCQPPLTTVHQHYEAISKAAVDAMLRLILQDDVMPVRRSLPVSLVERESTVG